IIADSHDLLPPHALLLGPAAQSMALRALAVQNVQDAEVAVVVLCLQNRDFADQVEFLEALPGLGHALDASAKHGLQGILSTECILQRHNVLYVGTVRLHPARDALV